MSCIINIVLLAMFRSFPIKIELKIQVCMRILLIDLLGFSKAMRR